ncbi:hypothetical protein KMZ15_02725 [Mycoavidus sp. HKI]|uniref:hypothetical protein n=1 Tax=Mycoavidus sp. HKI TaxID=2840467 RepID=UPI001CBE4FED|nr:hypothetical protein [Mycoavidus sp. HKI]UAW64610.1 hypothetical protein KMZ15_02725 [Mycoavidus sp. HKI]
MMLRRLFVLCAACFLSGACSAPSSVVVSPGPAKQAALRYRADLHAELALAYLDKEQFEVARREAALALQLTADHRDALHALALIERAAGNVQAAGQYFQQALAVKSGKDDPLLRLNYARFLDEQARRTVFDD